MSTPHKCPGLGMNTVTEAEMRALRAGCVASVGFNGPLTPYACRAIVAAFREPDGWILESEIDGEWVTCYEGSRSIFSRAEAETRLTEWRRPRPVWIGEPAPVTREPRLDFLDGRAIGFVAPRPEVNDG